MTNYERLRWLTFRVMPVHLQTVRQDIKRLIRLTDKTSHRMSILDVGGRKSPYTIGLPASITLLDVPQESGTRQDLNLGFTEDILTTIQRKRSNIANLVIQDMTQSSIPDASYDAVLCVEVIEHVEEDESFVKNISKVIKAGGWAYFTTPNGDYIKNEGSSRNLDHVRHYTREELKALLERHFKSVEVHYAVKTGKIRVAGLKSFKKNNPFGVLKSMACNVVNRFESKGLENSPIKTAHLVAICFK